MSHADEINSLPSELVDVDATFVASALRQRYPNTTVDQMTIADLHQGSASSLRLRLVYSDNPHDLPESMFLKGDFTEHNFTSAAAFAAEAHYFQHLAAGLSDAVNQPDCYFAGVDDTGQAIVLLEDLAERDVRFGDCEEPLDVDTVADGIRQLAAMQGRFWQGRGLESHNWMSDVASVAELMMFLVQSEHFDDYVNRERAGFLSAELRDRARVESALQAMFESDKAVPKALVHGDAHLGNTFRDPSAGLGFCDFQAMGRGPYIWDATYFMTGALSPDDRSSNEQALLALYLDELSRTGADEVPALEEAFLAHRRHMVHGYLNILTPVQMQPDRFAVAMGTRFAAAMDELDTLRSFS